MVKTQRREMIAIQAFEVGARRHLGLLEEKPEGLVKPTELVEYSKIHHVRAADEALDRVGLGPQRADLVDPEPGIVDRKGKAENVLPRCRELERSRDRTGDGIRIVVDSQIESRSHFPRDLIAADDHATRFFESKNLSAGADRLGVERAWVVGPIVEDQDPGLAQPERGQLPERILDLRPAVARREADLERVLNGDAPFIRRRTARTFSGFGAPNARMLLGGAVFKAFAVVYPAAMPPLATLLICAYNHERFVAEAVRGALAQTYQPLEILICDDASTDATGKAISGALEGYSGPHRISMLTNDANIGLSATLNKAMTMAAGEFVIGAAGDDVSLPDRVAALLDAYRALNGKATLIYSDAYVTDAEGRPQRRLYPQSPDPRRHDLAWAAAEEFSIFGCTMGWHRDAFDLFGPLPDRLSMEDLVIPFRAAILGEIRYLEKPLVHYREHGANVYLGTASENMAASQWHGALAHRARLEQAGFRAVIADLERATALFPQRTGEFAQLRQLTQRRLERAVATDLAFGGSSFATRLAVTARMLRQDGLGRRSVRWLSTLFLPRLYLARLRRTTSRIAREGLAGLQEARAGQEIWPRDTLNQPSATPRK